METEKRMGKVVACTLHCTSRSCTQKNVFISQMLRFEICKTHEGGGGRRGGGRGLTCPVNATRSIAHATPLNRVSTGKGWKTSKVFSILKHVEFPLSLGKKMKIIKKRKILKTERGRGRERKERESSFLLSPSFFPPLPLSSFLLIFNFLFKICFLNVKIDKVESGGIFFFFYYYSEYFVSGIDNEELFFFFISFRVERKMIRFD